MKKKLIKFAIMICVMSTSSIAHNTSIWEGNAAEIWSKLQPIGSAKLVTMQTNENDLEHQQWIQLALISKKYSTSTPQLTEALMSWREQFPSHPADGLIPSNEVLTQLSTAAPPQHVAVLLPLSGSFASSGQKVREGFIKAYYENLAHSGNQRIRFYDTSPSTDVNSLYQKAVADGADFIIGPLVKSNVEQVSGLKTFTTPTLALNYTDISSTELPQLFYEFGLMPEDEALQIAMRAHTDGHQRAIIIAPENDWGRHLVSVFSSRWQTLGGNIQQTWYYTSRASFSREIAILMGINPDDHDKSHLQQRRQDFDVIFLFSQSSDARSIVPLLRFNEANDVAIYATSSSDTGKRNPETNVDLNGVIICDIPWDKNEHSGNDTQANRLFAVGRDAYLLMQALPRLQQLPHFAMYAATGALLLTSQHQIRRHIPCAPITNGHI